MKAIGVFALNVVFVLPVVVLVLSAVAARWVAPDLLPTAWSLRGIAFLVQNRGGVTTAVLSSVM
jgi:hypothetical protein